MIPAETEKQLSDLSAEYIYNEGLGNILLLAVSGAKRASQNRLTSFEIPDSIKAMRAETDKYITELEDYLNGEKDRFEALEKITEIKKTLVDEYKNVYDYYSLWNTYSLPLTDEVAVRKYKEEHLASKKVQYEMFYTDCVNFLTSSENISELRKFTSQLLKCMPMRMARGRFFDIVMRSLKAAFDGESEDCITKSLEAFKRGCAPTSVASYGSLFPEIAEWFASKEKTVFAHLDDEQLYAEYDDFNIMLDTLREIEDCFTELYDDINSLIIVLYLNFTFDELTEGSASYADLFHAVVDIMTGEVSRAEAEAMLDTLNAQLEDAFEPVIDKLNSINDREIKLMDKIGHMSQLSEETQKSISAEGFIRGIYYSDINDEIFDFSIDEGSKTASKEFAENAFRDFIDYMQEYYKELPSQMRKADMLTMLGSIPVTMDIPDTIEYIKSSVENCIDEEQKLLIIDKSGEVFTSNGFQYAQENDECSCHDHHHDHDHNHHHNCSCHDHDHHHDHLCSCHDH